MERPPRPRENSSFYESPLGRFEVLEPSVLRAIDIGNADRAFIHTLSGNRYMIRHSKTRGGALIIYNERDGGFGPENGHPFRVASEEIGVVGQPLKYWKISDESGPQPRGVMYNSTVINRIEIRKGFEAAVEAAAARQENEDTIRVSRPMIDEIYGRNASRKGK